jgi:hypothetical protein
MGLGWRTRVPDESLGLVQIVRTLPEFIGTKRKITRNIVPQDIGALIVLWKRYPPMEAHVSLVSLAVSTGRCNTI